MNYTLHQLRVFLSVSQNRSITKAAEELNLTQPAISIQLRQFQEQFDVPLTELISRRVHLTEFGKEIARAAERVLAEVAAIDQKTLAYKGQLGGTLRLSIVSTAQYMLPAFLHDFYRDNHGVRLSVDVTNKSGVISKLEQNAVDFALVSVMPKGMQLETLDLMTNKLYLVGSDKLVPRTKRFEQSMLKDLPFIYREGGSGTRHIMEAFVQRHRMPVSKKLELSSNEAVKQAVIAGLGCSIMPIISMKNELDSKQLRILPLKAFPLLSMWRLIWLKGKKFSPVAEAFLRYIEDEKESIVRREFGWTKKYE